MVDLELHPVESCRKGPAAVRGERADEPSHGIQVAQAHSSETRMRLGGPQILQHIQTIGETAVVAMIKWLIVARGLGDRTGHEGEKASMLVGWSSLLSVEAAKCCAILVVVPT